MSNFKFKKGDRIVTQIQTNSGIDSIKKGTIGTIEDFLSEDMAIIRYDSNNIAGVPVTTIRLATSDELSGIHPNSVLNNNFHLGSAWRTIPHYKLLNDKEVFEIYGITLSQNQNDDIFHVKPLGENVQENRTFDLKRRTIEDCLVKYNPELEKQLGEEITEKGELYDLRPGMRVKAKARIGMPLELFKLVAVIVDIDEDEEIVKLGFYHDNEIKYINNKITNIKPATEEEINLSNHKNLIDSRYHVGNRFKANDMVQYVFQLNEVIEPRQIIEIVEIEKVASYVLEDKFKVRKSDGTTFSLLTYDIHSYFEPTNEIEIEGTDTTVEEVEFLVDPSPEEIEFNNEVREYIEKEEQLVYNNNNFETEVKAATLGYTPESNLTPEEFIKNQESIEEELEKVFIKKVEIRGYDFDLEEETFSGPFDVKYEDIDNYIKALTTLKKFYKF